MPKALLGSVEQKLFRRITNKKAFRLEGFFQSVYKIMQW